MNTIKISKNKKIGRILDICTIIIIKIKFGFSKDQKYRIYKYKLIRN